MLTPEEVGSEIQRSVRLREPLRVFWVTVVGNRDDFARRIAACLEGWPVVCDVLRKERFRDPNALMLDVVTTINDVRGRIERIANTAREAGGVDIVLVSRTQWGMADAASPLELPMWFPVGAGSIPVVKILDLTWSARVSVADKVVALDDMRRLLYELDLGLVNVLDARMAKDRNKVRSLWYRVWKPDVGDEEIRRELDRIRGDLERVENPTGYRPSALRRPSVVGKLWAHTNKTSPDALPGTAAVLAQALGLEGVHYRENPLLEVLNRSTNPSRT